MSSGIPDRLLETDKTLAFLDINPLSSGPAATSPLLPSPTSSHRQLIIPKPYLEKLHHVPGAELSERLPTANKLSITVLTVEHNILQNRRGAHQLIDHVYIHMIPKPNTKQGLGIERPAQATDMDWLKVLFEGLKTRI
ncbi:unnamed protein product [Tuber aestivum]|uniref:HIT domain-containing protein n=1 Tax=Tuber aestivum TaxID=59557 RepID=A0A292PJN1_9PEZI|nr:unnamed protein product [Tuber aestivum]